MAKRGPYGKGIERREQILDAALRTIAERGYSATSVAELADAVGLSQGGLLHYFGSKEELFIAVLRKRDESDVATALHGCAPEAFIEVIRRNTEVPGLIELFTHMQAAASDPTHPAHDYMRQRYSLGVQAFSYALREMQTAGTLPTDIDTDSAATMFFALADGLQARWLIDPTIDMAAQLEQTWRRYIGNTPR
ncbi:MULTISPECIES: TetR/AcrR family transcriptional regulator [unclassified Nocardia]|uniref:TetR/AcrR family transcriptional regulator n=1 Tax=unclassified Nocardia TaxID=2637762 RepID=UPI00343A2AB4